MLHYLIYDPDFNRTGVPVVFMGAVVLTLLLSWLSDSLPHQKTSLMLLLAWCTTNVAQNLYGIVDAPVAIPSMDAVIALLLALQYRSHPSRIVGLVLGLYVPVGVTWLLAFVLHLQSSYTCYATANILFAVQLLVLGASGAWLALHHRAVGSRQRLRADTPRRASA